MMAITTTATPMIVKMDVFCPPLPDEKSRFNAKSMVNTREMVVRLLEEELRRLRVVVVRRRVVVRNKSSNGDRLPMVIERADVIPINLALKIK
jgi:hypothetical protein